MIKSKVARQYRDNYGMDMPTLKLARIMYAENNLIFKHVEDCRDALRRIEGKTGNKKVKHIIKTKYYMNEERPKNPYKLPASQADPVFLHHRTTTLFRSWTGASTNSAT